MIDKFRYPRFNDRPHERPVLRVYSRTVFGELMWVLVPVAVIVIGLLIR